MNLVDWVLIGAYGSLLIEILGFPIPSEASTWQLLTTREPKSNGGELARARRFSVASKLFRFLLPTACGVVLFLLPLATLVPDALPGLSSYLESARTPALLGLGTALVVVGRATTFLSVLQLRAQRRKAPGSATGLFRWSRNPGLLGMFTFYLGLCCLFPTLVLWLGLPLYFGNMNHRVRLEEAHLLAQNGDAWRDYARRVPRYLPLPGLRG